jgi:hypothetical protein
MRRILLAPLAALAILGASRDACAQKPEEPSVHVRVRMEREGEVADVLVDRYGKWAFVCRAPCTFDAAPGEHVRIHVLSNDRDDEPLAFSVPREADASHDVDIDVGHRGRGAFIAGLAAIGGGAISLALGMAIIRGAGKDDLFGSANGFIGRLGLLLGAVAVGTGAYLIVTRSTAPVILPTTRAQAHDDLAVPGTSSSIELRDVPLQLGWTVRF